MADERRGVRDGARSRRSVSWAAQQDQAPRWQLERHGSYGKANRPSLASSRWAMAASGDDVTSAGGSWDRGRAKNRQRVKDLRTDHQAVAGWWAVAAGRNGLSGKVMPFAFGSSALLVEERT